MKDNSSDPKTPLTSVASHPNKGTDPKTPVNSAASSASRRLILTPRGLLSPTSNKRTTPAKRTPSSAALTNSLTKQKKKLGEDVANLDKQLRGLKNQYSNLLRMLNDADIEMCDHDFEHDERLEVAQARVASVEQDHQLFMTAYEAWKGQRQKEVDDLLLKINAVERQKHVISGRLHEVERCLLGDFSEGQNFALYKLADLRVQYDVETLDDLKEQVDEKGNKVWTIESMVDLFRRFKKGHLVENEELHERWSKLTEDDWKRLNIPENERTEKPKIFAHKGTLDENVFRGRMVLYLDLDY